MKKGAKAGADDSGPAVPDELVRLSRALGSNGELVLAGGGNTSVKSGEKIFVKASGLSLAGITADGFAAVDRGALREVLTRDLDGDADRREQQFKEAVMAARLDDDAPRPSVECALHEIFPPRFVAHLHPTAVNAVTCSSSGEAIAREIFGEDVLWAPYVDPGYTLAKELARLLADWSERTGRDCPRAVLMQNHGLLLGGEDADEVASAVDAMVKAAKQRLDASASDAPFGPVKCFDGEEAKRLINVIGPALRALLSDGAAPGVVTFDDCEALKALAGGENGREAAMGGPLTPDQVVYCRPFPLWFETTSGEDAGGVVAALREAVDSHRSQYGRPPKVVIAQGLGLFAAGGGFGEAEAARLLYADAVKVTAGALALGGVKYLTRERYEFIDNWEVEQYRRRVAKAEPVEGRAAGRVAVVTGAAQGFGLEISRDLAREGAHVALADVNFDGARARAGEVAAETGEGRAMAVRMDVTSPPSVEEALHLVVRTYGGFDILVSNAGILRAASVKTQAEGDFDAVTAVNYRGYFLCVKHAAPILSVQHLARGDYLSDIIQINSKSGLEGSNRNSAYAGSKFGGIGLTQSFAKELVEDGVKVNAICPGNYFDGPLWSDPETGLFAQYLRSGKVPGAKTVEDVRRAYESKIPMGRGCTAADVMKALYYLVEQEYETGQAIAVTGGQVMLR